MAPRKPDPEPLPVPTTLLADVKRVALALMHEGKLKPHQALTILSTTVQTLFAARGGHEILAKDPQALRADRVILCALGVAVEPLSSVPVEDALIDKE